MSPLHQWAYALACVLAPVAWGLLMVWATTRMEAAVRRRAARGGDRERTSPDQGKEVSDLSPEYHI